ncbi:GNAT family N-acetyltransferase [Catellatospora bangladeshensis]|uniref:N-acetyltransferase domain-containing protein n=2 Tax=Catellatospora bangladeshensis TaxID=310355 RepID=A0A8J3JJK7_9ACTN|nr:GNAT family N-acetyltransferase [Catellatospora bangladeshensis]GIF86016.1 hypothetical protein Cba03nite_73650 [Catellatospora bangladeshensis]
MMLDIERQLSSGATAVEIVFRGADETDLAQVLDLHARCSPESLRRRYTSGAGAPSPARIARTLAPEAGHTLLATVVGGADDGRAVAMGQLFHTGDGCGEIAFLVADAWQRCGLGTELARRLTVLAPALGHGGVVAHVLSLNQPALRMLRRLAADGALDPSWEYDGPLVTMRSAVGAPRG